MVIESKSVVGQLMVNHRGEFARLRDGQPLGMQSPIYQAKLKQDLLCKLPNDHKEQQRPTVNASFARLVSEDLIAKVEAVATIVRQKQPGEHAQWFFVVLGTKLAARHRSIVGRDRAGRHARLSVGLDPDS